MATKDQVGAKSVVSELIITRDLDAPRELVWRAWTEPERVKQWWGPRGFTTPFSEIDLRVGGTYLSCMRSAEGKEYWSTGVYRAIAAPERLVFTDSLADEKGNPVPASHYDMPGNWPDELLVTVTLETQRDETRMTMRHAGIPEGQMREECEKGWNESFDKLEHSLKGAQKK